ncbi:MAG TPA: HupE / UreJ protein [Chitinophagaceae bacterium]|nr:HupE / UreJ protein [Chitinophagaceae bacterium]
MSDFSIYFGIGYEHIADFKEFKGLDHILFILALTLRYQWSDWKKLLILVTAFTIGHSISLALTALDIIDPPMNWVEFLIPLTIVITAATNVGVKKFNFKSKFPLIYFLAIFFGLIHGMGFGYGLKSLLGKGTELLMPLLAFNVGLELGQLVVVLAILLLTFIFTGLLKVNRREYLLFASAMVFALALQMSIERAPFLNH